MTRTWAALADDEEARARVVGTSPSLSDAAATSSVVR
jgi:hypothetical protein